MSFLPSHPIGRQIQTEPARAAANPLLCGCFYYLRYPRVKNKYTYVIALTTYVLST
jgi:hypothetical protein